MSNNPKSKKETPLTRERAREIAAKYGIGECPPDHPIYSEPPSIMFLNRPRKPKPESDDED
jgi:hypothetical protein